MVNVIIDLLNTWKYKEYLKINFSKVLKYLISFDKLICLDIYTNVYSYT